MPKLKLTPIDHGPAPAGSAMFVKLFGLVLLTLSLVGVMYMLLTMSGDDVSETWSYDPTEIRTNFHELMTTEQIAALLKQKRADWLTEQGLDELPPGLGGAMSDDGADNGDDGELPAPFGNDETELPPPDTPGPAETGVDQREEARRDERHELKLGESLARERVFKIGDEVQNLIDFVPFRDASREFCMNEWDAYKGRQAPTNERLALQVLKKLPAPGDDGYEAYLEKVEQDGWYFGKSQAALDLYRGRGFSIGDRGRLFDLYEIKPDEPVVLNDGTKVESYYEGVVAFIGEGKARNEHPIVPRTVMFQSLAIPAELKEYVNTSGHVSHEDKLVAEDVMVEFTGAFLRRWVYSREVVPFSTRAKRVFSQDWMPLLLSADIAVSDAKDYELTDELLQQVRDAYRGDPTFLETEAAYYAMLDLANSPDDTVEALEEIGYFDLAGEETGPRYRGQGVHVSGMIGDNYAPVILPPNISGLRRVYRALVLDDTADLNTPKRYMVDMIEPPTGLEPRALVDFKARYYRNVHEAESTTSTVRPLLIVKRVGRHGSDAGGDDWFFAVVGIVGVVLLLGILSFFIFSERKERARFEQSTLELSQKRLKARGGLKLKPLPGAGNDPPAEAEGKPDSKEDDKDDNKD